MPPLLPLLLLALPSADAAVARALALPGARAEAEEIRIASGAGCAPETVEALRLVVASGDVPLRLEGADAAGRRCQVFGWSRVRVLAPALALVRDVPAGEPLSGAVREAEAEVRPGRPPLATLPEGAAAARALRAGALLAPADVRAGPAPGSAVAVLVRAGGIELETVGRAIPCSRGRACALLDGNRRVEGRLAGGRLVVEAP